MEEGVTFAMPSLHRRDLLDIGKMPRTAKEAKKVKTVTQSALKPRET